MTSLPPCNLMKYTILDLAPGSSQFAARIDEELMHYVVCKGPAAAIWEMPKGLVVPRTYKNSKTFNKALDVMHKKGWPVHIRHSGGGVVPQGPGILNLSMAYAVNGLPLDNSTNAYTQICDVISKSLSKFGLYTWPAAVEGSFCDGRFNLACNFNGQARKIAGTAQLWRRISHPTNGYTVQVVLVHALLLVECCIQEITNQANCLEELLGNSRRYKEDSAVSVQQLITNKHLINRSLSEAISQELRHTISRIHAVETEVH